MIIKLSHYISCFLKRGPYVRCYDGQTKCMYLLIEDDELLGKYNTIWNKVSADIKQEFDRLSIIKIF